MKLHATTPLLLLLGACTTTTPQTPHLPSSHSLAAPAIPTTPAAPVATETNSETWGSIDTTSRYLLIMGSIDGFAAAGATAPCFPGQDNTSLDAELIASGFGTQETKVLPTALTKLPSASQCQSQRLRGYDTTLLKSMPDAHLASYLTGAVRAYATHKECPNENHSYAAAVAVAAIHSNQSAEQPSAMLARAFGEGCLGPQDK